jgi:hypothetical protein
MKQKILISALTITLNSTVMFSQETFNVPQNVELKKVEDYAKYEQDVINAAKWLENTDLNKEQEKRKEVFGFVFAWISGSPNVSVEISENLAKIYDKNTDLLAIYLASYTRFSLENKSNTSKDDVSLAGLQAVIKVYQKGINIKKNKELEKLSKYTEAELKTYIAKNLK